MRSERLFPCVPVVLVIAGCASGSETSASGGGASAASSAGAGGAAPERCPTDTGPLVALDIATLDDGGLATLSDGSLWCWGNDYFAICDSVPEVWRPHRRDVDLCFDRVVARGPFAAATTQPGDLVAWGVVTNNELIPLATGPLTWVDAEHGRVQWGLGSKAWTQEFDGLLEPTYEYPHAADRLHHRNTYQFFIRDGVLYGVGANGNGQLGDGTIIDRAEPVALEVPGPVVEIDCNFSSSCCALNAAGELWCWRSILVDPPSDALEPLGPTPERYGDVPPFCGIEHSAGFSCGWSCEGEVTCWGYNSGAILEPLPEPPRQDLIPPRRFPDLEPASKIVSSETGPLCSLKIDGTVWCRGRANGGPGTAPTGAPAVRVEFVEDP